MVIVSLTNDVDDTSEFYTRKRKTVSIVVVLVIGNKENEKTNLIYKFNVEVK